MGPMSANQVRRIYRNRIDILKRLGSEARRTTVDVDSRKYVVLPHGQVVKRSTVAAGKLYVNGLKVQASDGI